MEGLRRFNLVAPSPSVVGNDLAQNQIDNEGEPEADKPGVVVEIDW